MDVDQVLLASPRGFCAGVEMAIKALAWMVRAFEPPVYCYHEIVHNRAVVRQFEAAGVVFVDEIDDVPAGRPLMLSAHGSAPEVVEAAQAKGGYVVDAVCPLVTKVHHEVKVRAGKGYQIVYVGHAGHEEAVGTMAVAPESIHRVESLDDVAGLPELGESVAMLAQTTLSHRDWEGVRDATKARFPTMWMPGRSDLCFATTNRQGALAEIAARCDAVVVIGSANSSNTRALEKLAVESGAAQVLRINGPDELPDHLDRHSRRHGGRIGPRVRRGGRDRPTRTPSRCRGGAVSPTRTSTSHRPGACATSWRASTRSPRSRSAARSAIDHRRTTGVSSPPMPWLPSRPAFRARSVPTRQTVHHDCELHAHGRVHRRAVGGDRR